MASNPPSSRAAAASVFWLRDPARLPAGWPDRPFANSRPRACFGGFGKSASVIGISLVNRRCRFRPRDRRKMLFRHFLLLRQYWNLEFAGTSVKPIRRRPSSKPPIGSGRASKLLLSDGAAPTSCGPQARDVKGTADRILQESGHPREAGRTRLLLLRLHTLGEDFTKLSAAF